MLKTCGVLLLALLVVSGDELESGEESVYTAAIGKQVSGSVDDGTNAIFKFLGFKCPKGHRCLPVLECLPCDYGTYKSDEGSDLCENCPVGCTTLRKGAVNWKECVPKCPPGYEESKCGKTCTKCRAGYYKSNWKNMLCRQCPKNSNWNKNMVGMKKKSQCYSTPPTTKSPTESTSRRPTEPSDETVEDRCYNEHGTCTFDEYNNRRLTALHGTNCEMFCQCAHASTNGDVTYYWEEHDCPLRTLFDEKFSICNHESLVNCTDTGPSPTPSVNNSSSTKSPSQGTTEPSDEPIGVPGADDCFNEHGTCTLDEYNNKRLTALHNTYCEEFCQCAHASTKEDGTVTYYWVQHQCPSTTLFNEASSVCDHDYNVECTDTGPVTPSPSNTSSSTKSSSQGTEEPSDEPIGVPGADDCFHEHGTCTLDEYNNKRLTALHNTYCEEFCQCAHASTEEDGTVTYYWVQHQCPSTTLFNEASSVCDHDYNVECTDTGPVTPSPGNTSSSTKSSSPGPEEPSDEPIGVPGADDCFHEHGTCTLDEYNNKRLTALHNTYCEEFCQCAHASTEGDGTVTYYWVQHQCPSTTLFNEASSVCDHDYNVECTDTGPVTLSPGNTSSSTKSPSQGPAEPNDEPIGVPGADDCFHEHGTCTLDEYNNKRLTALHDTNCEEFCQCAHASTEEDGTVTYYWVQHQCPSTTLFDESLSICNYDYKVECTDTGPAEPSPTVIAPTEAADVGCIEGDACTQHDYAVKRLKPLYGSLCEQFCHCAKDEGSAGTDVYYYWEVQTCADGTLFDESLPTPVCNHDYLVDCHDDDHSP